MNHQALSLCLIAKNSAATLPPALSCVAGIAADSIVVDTGSTDGTPEVAAAHGARVFHYTWTDSFAAARNESLRQATGDWIFRLDADEYLDEPNQQKLKSLISELRDKISELRDENVAFVMKQRSPPTRDRSTALYVDHVRLFRNWPEHRWQYRVHEQILPSLQRTGAKPIWTDIVIEHTGYEDPAVRQQKLLRNHRLLEIDVAENPNDPFILFNIGWSLCELGRVAGTQRIHHQGYKEHKFRKAASFNIIRGGAHGTEHFPARLLWVDGARIGWRIWTPLWREWRRTTAERRSEPDAQRGRYGSAQPHDDVPL